MRSILITLIFLKNVALGSGERDRLVVWNVGQGSWATVMRGYDCLHFDMGGERPPPAPLLKNCQVVANYVYLSHLDWDHISYLGWWQRRTRSLCRTKVTRDAVRAKGPKARYLERIPLCPHTPRQVKELKFTLPATAAANSLSRVFTYGQTLFPGDSTRTAEKFWAPQAARQKPRLLILGHHGSRTSTSEFLLKELPTLKMAAVSARQKRYGHPHSQVTTALKVRNIPLLRTERWGHLVFEM